MTKTPTHTQHTRTTRSQHKNTSAGAGDLSKGRQMHKNRKKQTAMHYHTSQIDTNQSSSCRFGPQPYCPIRAYENSKKILYDWAQNILTSVLFGWKKHPTVSPMRNWRRCSKKGRRLCVGCVVWLCGFIFYRLKPDCGPDIKVDFFFFDDNLKYLKQGHPAC